jgi:hypothetical protein
VHYFLGGISSQVDELLQGFSEIREAFKSLDTSHQNGRYFGHTNLNDASFFAESKLCSFCWYILLPHF